MEILFHKDILSTLVFQLEQVAMGKTDDPAPVPYLAIRTKDS